jgi:photosystem II stability/assembly factor-like uncharacterized protein
MNQTKVLIVLFSVIFCTSLTFSDGFNDVYSKDGSQVIAVGPTGNVFMSYDAGATFGSYPQGSNNLNSVFAINQKICIVGDLGTVLVSTNGGVSFSTYTYNGANLNGVYFYDDNVGWLVGNTGIIAKSTNGGVNWTAQTSPVGVNLKDVKFTSASNGYACGDNGTVIYTTNGGTNWLSYTTGTTKNLNAIDVNGSIIICAANDGVILKYNGSSWSTIDYKIVTKTDVRGVSMVSSNTFYTCGGGGFINMTTDGGVTRTYQANPMMAPLKAIYMYNSTKGWAVSSANNAILRTSNGGTWLFQSAVTVNYSYTIKQATSGNIGNPFCLHPKNKNGVFILAGSSLYRSLDRGETWTLLNGAIPGSSCHSFFVNALDTNLMLATKGSGSGRVIRSTDYGTTWTDVINPINLTSYGMPLEVDPNNPNTVYLAPDNAPLRKSTDWGANWTLLSGGEPGGTFRSPCDVVVQFENPNTIVVGDGTTGSGSGKVWKSTDGGLNWTLINTVSGSEIPMLANSSLDLNVMFHSTWSSGSFWKSTNMGTSFSNLSQGGSLWACDVAKDDPTAVTYDVYGSTSYISVDGGSTFTSGINVGSSPAAGVCFLDKSCLIYQHGGGIHKLNVTYTVTPVLSNQQISSEVPSQFSLDQNYPNPFNPNTVINYSVSKESFISIKVYDVTGREVKTLISGRIAPGKYKTDFDASSISGGVYFYTMLSNGERIDTRKMILVK